MKELIKADKEFQEFNPILKDMLCRTYNYIIRWQDVKNHISFTFDGIRNAEAALSCVGTPSDKWVNTFIANLDKIKTLAENQPNNIIRITFRFHEDTPFYLGKRVDKAIDNYYTSTYDETFKTYSLNHYHEKIGYYKRLRHYYSHEIITDSKTECK